jgi:hypothetical protein
LQLLQPLDRITHVNKSEDPFKLARRHWPCLALAMFCPLAMMLLTLGADIRGQPLPVAVHNVVFGGGFLLTFAGIILFQIRSGLPGITAMGVVATPIIATWIFFILVRGLILTLLGRPL